MVKYALLATVAFFLFIIASCAGVKYLFPAKLEADSPAEEVAETISERLIEEMLDLQNGALKDKIDFTPTSLEKKEA